MFLPIWCICKHVHRHKPHTAVHNAAVVYMNWSIFVGSFRDPQQQVDGNVLEEQHLFSAEAASCACSALLLIKLSESESDTGLMDHSLIWL